MNKFNELNEAQLILIATTNENNDNTNDNGDKAQGHATSSESVHR